jgi:hypothetical protein
MASCGIALLQLSKVAERRETAAENCKLRYENKAWQTRWPCQYLRCCTSTYLLTVSTLWTPKQSILL